MTTSKSFSDDFNISFISKLVSIVSSFSKYTMKSVLCLSFSPVSSGFQLNSGHFHVKLWDPGFCLNPQSSLGLSHNQSGRRSEGTASLLPGGNRYSGTPLGLLKHLASPCHGWE